MSIYFGPGQPRVIKNADELRQGLDSYFDRVLNNEEKPTFTGLCLHLGYCSRQSFYDNEKIPEYSYLLKRARMIVERYYEGRLSEAACTGAIFALKNFGWKDESQVENTIRDERWKVEVDGVHFKTTLDAPEAGGYLGESPQV